MDLNLIEKYHEIDTEDFIKEIESLPKQLKLTWQQAKSFVLAPYYFKINKILLVGMGGSGISGKYLQNLAEPQYKIPFFVHQDYGIPKFVDDKTLVISLSHSGNTEKTIDATKLAIDRGAKVIGLASGGEMIKLAAKYHFPIMQYQSFGGPRTNIGNMMGAILGILKKIGIIDNLTDQDINEAIYFLKEWIKKSAIKVPVTENLAKQIANRIFNHLPIIWAANPLQSVACRWKNDLNENAKTISYYEILPELNHNSLSGLKFPNENKIFIIILKSKFYHQKNIKRLKICQELLEEKQIPYQIIMIEPSGHILSEILCYTLLGEYISYYLAILNDQDPKTIPEVDFIKSKLK